MIPIYPKILDTAFVVTGTPMFSDLIKQIQSDSSLSNERRRDLVSGLKRVAKALDRSPATVPADSQWLQPRLSKVEPASLNLSPKSWSNILSDARAAMNHAGITEKRRFNRLENLSPAWQALWRQVLANKDRSVSSLLGRFVYFLDHQDIAPEDVRDAHAIAFRDAVALNEISRSPDRSYRNAVSIWNLAVDRFPEWPRQRLTAPSRQKVDKLPLEQFSPSFQADLERYVQTLSDPDPFDVNCRLHPLSPSTVKLYKARLIRFASLLVRDGVPVEALDGLGTMLDPVLVKRGLKIMLDRNDGETSASISDAAILLNGIARTYLSAPTDIQAALDDLAKRVAQKQPQGLTAKNRERLRALDDPISRRNFLRLPERLFEEADQRDIGQKSCATRENAVAIAILQYCPVRVKNLASIHLERSLHRPGDGRVFLVFRANEVKNGSHIEIELLPHVVEMIDRHVSLRAGILCDPTSPWLFPMRRQDRGMDPNRLSRQISQTIRKSIGLEINAHLFRHIAAKLMLEARPGEYESVRRLLGHSRMSRTLNCYAGFEAGTATRLFAEIVDQGKAS